MSAKGYRAIRSPGSEPGGAVQRALVIGVELPQLAGPQPPEPDRPDPNAHQPSHRKADRVEHPAHLALATLDHYQPDPAAALGAAGRTRLDRPGDPVLQLDPPLQSRELTVRGRAVDLGQVLLLDLEPRVREPVRELAVVGQQQEALGVPVEPPDREHVHVLRKQVGQVPFGVRVAHRGRDAPGLVEREGPQRRIDVDPRAVDADLILRWIHAVAERRGLPVDLDAPGDDQLLAGPARSEPGPGERTLQPLLGHRVSRRRRPRSPMPAGSAAGAARATGARTATTGPAARGTRASSRTAPAGPASPRGRPRPPGRDRPARAGRPRSSRRARPRSGGASPAAYTRRSPASR